MTSALVEDGGEVVAQSLGGGHAAIPVGGHAGDGDGPPLEGREIGPGQPEDLSDDLDGEVEGDLLDQVGLPTVGKTVDQLVHHPLDQVALPPL